MICEELLGLLYGSIVNEVLRNSQNIPQANQRLQKIGYKIGTKIVDEFMRDTNIRPCRKIDELIEKFCNIGVKKFLNPTETRCEEILKKEQGYEFKLRIIGNPLFNYVEVPAELQSGYLKLQYQAIIKGAIRGAFEILKFKANIVVIHDCFEGEKKGTRNESIFLVDISKDIC